MAVFNIEPNDLNALGWSATGTSVNFSNEDAGLDSLQRRA